MDLSKFDLDYQFNFYLEKVKLKKENMSPTQLKETKQAFIAGITQMMVLNTEIGQQPYVKSKVAIEKIWKQCSDYWTEKLREIQSREN